MSLMRRFLCCAAVCILSLFFVPAGVCDAESVYDPVTAEIPVSCLLQNGGDETSFRIEITALQQTSPLPSPEFRMIRPDSTEFFSVTADEPGSYQYRISEIPGTEPGMIYDDTVYLVTVYVENDENGKLLWAVTAQKEESEEKPDKIEFINENTVTTTTTATTTATSTTTTTTTTATVTQTTTATTVTETTTTATQPSRIDRIINVLTGDFTPVRLFVTLGIGAAAVGCTMMLLRKRKNDSEQDLK